MRSKRAGLIPLVVASLFVFSGLALASEHEDTTFNYGYDDANRLLLINAIPWGEDADASDPPCQIDEDLTDEDGTEHEVEYTFGDPIVVNPLVLGEGTPEAETCELQAAEVSGPNGQVNHGMIMKAFKTLYDGDHRGCVNRYLAQSDFGKGDQQVLASDPTASEFVAETSPSLVEFFTALADCDRGDEADIESEFETEGNGNGKGKGKGRPDSPGKSGSAPGRQGR